MRRMAARFNFSGQPARPDANERLSSIGQPQQSEHGDRHDLAKDGETVEQERHASANDGRFDQI